MRLCLLPEALNQQVIQSLSSMSAMCRCRSMGVARARKATVSAVLERKSRIFCEQWWHLLPCQVTTEAPLPLQ